MDGLKTTVIKSALKTDQNFLPTTVFALSIWRARASFIPLNEKKEYREIQKPCHVLLTTLNLGHLKDIQCIQVQEDSTVSTAQLVFLHCNQVKLFKRFLCI